MQPTPQPTSAIWRRSLIALALAGASAALMPAAPAFADVTRSQAEARDYAVSGGPLGVVLGRFAASAGVVLSFDAALTAGQQSPGLQGRFTVQEGFRRLLDGTGLGVVETATGYRLGRLSRGTGSVAELETVVVTDRAERESGLPGAVSTNGISREQLDRFPPTSTSDIFRDVPGVIALNARNGASFDLNIRGMQGDRVKVLVDGTQSSSNTSKSYGGEGSHNYVDPDLVGGIVIEKGPNSGPYGAGTGGGVVHLSTLTADDLLTDKPWAVRLRGGWANNGSDGKGFMDYTGANALSYKTPGDNWSGSLASAWRGLDDRLELVFAHSERRQGNYKAGSKGTETDRLTGQALALYKRDDEVFNTSSDTRSTLLKARLALPRDQWAELSYNRFESEFGESRLTSFDYNIEQKQLAEVDKTTWVLRHGWQPAGSKWWNLRTNLWQAELDELHPEVTYGVAGTTKSRGLELWNTSALELAGVGLTLSYGGSLQSEKTTGLGITEPRGEREMSSLFAQAEASLTRQLVLDAGVRRESYTTDGTGSFVSPVPGQNRIPYSVSDGHDRINPSVGLTFTPWAPASFYARYSEGWRPPTAKEVGLTYGYARQVLQPEVTKSTEAGVRLAFTDLLTAQDRLSVRLAWFDNRHDDYLTRTLSNNSNTPYYYFNISGARFRGTELNVSYDRGDLFASYGLNRYSKAEFCGFLTPQCTDRFVSDFGLLMFGLAVPPKQTQTATLGTRLLDRRLTLGLRANIASSAVGSLSTSTGQAMTHGWRAYQIYDLFGGYRVSDALELNVSVENLRDQYYLEAMSSPAIAIPAPGRTAKASFTYRF